MKRRISRRLKRNLLQKRPLRLEGLEQRQLLAADGLTLVPDAVQVTQNSDPILIDVLANDSFDEDYAGERRLTSFSTGSQGGRIEIVDGQISYAPPADASGVEEFQYTVDNLASSTVTIDIFSPVSDFHVTVDRFQDQYQFDLLADAQFPDDYQGDRKITLISETERLSYVELREDGQSVIYEPGLGVRGKDSFTYIVDGNFVGTAEVTVLDPIRPDQYEVLENSGTTNLAVLINDFDPKSSTAGDFYGVESFEQWDSIRDNGQITHVLDIDDSFEVTIRDDGRSVDFTPAENATGTKRFRYVIDGRFEQSVSVYVQRPVRNDAFPADINGSAHSFDVLENDHYDSIHGGRDIRIVDEISSVTQGSEGGTVEIAADGRTVLYTPAPDFTGFERFEYVANSKYTASVSVSVSQTIRDDWFTVNLGSRSSLPVLENDFLSAEVGEREITSVTETELGATVSIAAGGAIVYTPPEDVVTAAVDTFQYTVNGEITANVTVNLRSPVRSDLYFVDRAVVMSLDVLSNDSFDEDYLGNRSITSVSQPSDGGTVVIVGGNRLSYTPGSPSETFTYTVDNRFTKTVRTRPIGRLQTDHAVTDQNSQGVTIPVLGNDFSSNSYIERNHGLYEGPRTVSADVTSEQGGSVEVLTDGSIRYVPTLDFVGADQFTYNVDEFLTSTVYVNVIRRAADDTVRVAINSQNNPLNVLTNDIHGADYAGSGLITSVTDTTEGGVVTIADGGRTVLYTPPVGFSGEDSFVYTIDGSSKATVTVAVHDDANDSLEKFSSVSEFRDLIQGLAVERYEHLFGNERYVPFDDVFVSAGTTLSSTEQDNPSFSETNVQVAGVDEHDIVETDGFYIYTLRGNELTIVKSLPADELELVSRTPIVGNPVGMYLNGDRVTVISEPTPAIPEYPYPFPSYGDSRLAISDDFLYFPRPEPQPSSTFVTVLDVSDRAAPEVIGRTEFDGQFADSRRIDDQVFVILKSEALLPELEVTCESGDDGSEHCIYETEEQFVARLTNNFAEIIEDTLPSYQSLNGDGELVRGGPLLMPEDIFQTSNQATAMTLVASINMASNEPGLSAVSGVMSDAGSQFFASATSLYVFRSTTEPTESERWTEILKFNWNGSTGGIEFAATGAVPGTILNQFSADESDGQLRITTEISNSYTGNFSGDAETAVFVLQEDEGVMEFVGGLQNLAVGQHIKSVRYFGDRVFVTTYANADPLTAIDLSDASAPRALGHVPIPGFSSYMQFISPDRLLTIGTNTANGVTGRAMVTLFDVSDLTSPEVIDQHNLPRYSSSIASDDHHAFGWFANHSILSVPISRYFNERFDADEDGYREATRRVREDELTILNVGVNDSGAEGVTGVGQVSHEARVQRSVSINDFVYSVGLDGIRSVNVADAGTVVDEVLFDWELPDVSSPWVPIDYASIGAAARDVLAAELGVARSELFLVTQEQVDGSTDLIVRSGDEQFRLRGTDATDLAIAEESFVFPIDAVIQNSDNPYDTNGDGEVTASDVLMVINKVAGQASGTQVDQALRQINFRDRFVDTNGDGEATALDALQIINEMARMEARELTGNRDE
ncbi:MAG: beta-propeller domain-containing protein [Rubripirellula sp.]